VHDSATVNDSAAAAEPSNPTNATVDSELPASAATNVIKTPASVASSSAAAPVAVAKPVLKPKQAASDPIATVASDPIAEKEQKMMDFYRSQGRRSFGTHV
jgi:hypothetical protein